MFLAFDKVNVGPMNKHLQPLEELLSKDQHKEINFSKEFKSSCVVDKLPTS